MMTGNGSNAERVERLECQTALNAKRPVCRMSGVPIARNVEQAGMPNVRPKCQTQPSDKSPEIAICL